jgi:hypothetical protein
MAERESRPHRSSGSRDGKKTEPARRGKGVDAKRACTAAARYAQELTGRQPEGLTSLERTDDGWQIGIEVVESRRIPDSTDILAVYLIGLDQDGGLVSYRREQRYYRSRVEGRSDE